MRAIVPLAGILRRRLSRGRRGGTDWSTVVFACSIGRFPRGDCDILCRGCSPQSGPVGFGAIVLIADDVISILTGALMPMISVLKAVVLGALIRPVLLGLGWSVAVFALLNIRHHLQIIVRPPIVTATE